MNNQIHSVEEAKNHPEIFRVSIFGSARTKPEDVEYQRAYDLAYELGKKDISVVTGGGPGQMNAANEGHEKACSKHSNSIGLTIQLPWEADANKNLDLQAHFMEFGNRLRTFMDLSNVVVISAGGIGTCLELFYTLQLTQVGHINKLPIILMDDMWHHVMDWLEKDAVGRGFVSAKDLTNIIRVKDEKEAMEVIMKTKEAFDKKENVVLNGNVCESEGAVC